MEIPDYEPFYIGSLDALRAEIGRLGLDIPTSEDPSVLARPIEIGGKVVPNRFCAQPVAGGDAMDDGSPGPLTRRRYVAYSAGSFGLLWVERTAALGAEPLRHLCLSPSNVSQFAALLAAVRVASKTPPVVVLQLAPATQDRLLSAAKLAREAGFDGVDIQGDPETLPGTLARIRDAVPGLLLATRLCAYAAVRNGFGVSPTDFRAFDPTSSVQYTQRLADHGLQLLNVTSAHPVLVGRDRGARAKADYEPPDEHPLMTLARQLALVRSLQSRFPALPMVGSGLSWLRQFVPEVAAGALSLGWMHFAGLGRAALACPDLPAQILADRMLDPGKTCMVCFACSQLERSNRAVGCVVRDPDVYGPIFRDMRHLEQDTLLAGAACCHLCENAPCLAKSPTKTNIPAFIKAFREGRESDAYEIVKAANPLPQLVSQTSPFWLEEEGFCIEFALSGKPVPIRDLQYTVASRARERGETGIRIPNGRSGKTVAIVGGGPTGIAAAARLLELGHNIHLHETSDCLGGVASRLLAQNRPIEDPKAEIEALLHPALAADRLKIFFGSTLGKSVTVSELLAAHDSVLLALGLWREQSIGSAIGVLGGLDFLDRWTGPLPKRVVVLAGGDSAMDACRALKARGASQIYVVFRGPRSEMHWHMSESWFANPGVHAMMNWQPLRYETDSSGKLTGVRLRHTEFDSEMLLPADLAIEAMGLKPANDLLAPAGAQTSRLFSAGAMVNGGASVGQCVAEGLAIAETIHRSLLK